MNASGSDRATRTDGGKVVVREKDVEVAKSYDGERFPVPAIVFSIRSGREDSIEVRLVDRVPEEVSMDDIGFHPDYGSEFWSVEDHTLMFDRELAPEEEIEAVYGLRGPDADKPDFFLGEPAVEIRTGAETSGEGGGAPLDGTNESFVRSAMSAGNGESSEGESGGDERDDSGPGGDESADGAVAGGTAVTEDPEPVDETAVDGTATDVTSDERTGAESDDGGTTTPTENVPMDEDDTTDSERTDDPNATEANAAETAETTETDTTGVDSVPNGADRETEPDDAAAGGENGESATVEDTGDTLAATLARELRAGRVDADDRETLRDVLGPRDSVSVRIDRLQSEVSEVAAYADALESFIDENGSGEQLVRRQTERVDALREDVETVTEETATNRADIETIDDDVGSVEGEVEAVESEIETVREAIADFEETMERTDERLETVEERVEGTDDRFEEIERRLDALDDRVGEDEVEESDLDDLREDLETRTDERIADTEDSLQDVSADVEALESWRSQLSAVIGGAGETGTDGETDSDTETGADS